MTKKTLRMVRMSSLFLGAALLICAAPVNDALAEPAPRANIVIDTENLRIYRFDTFDAQSLSSDPGPTAPLPLRNFMDVIWLADIVAVNGSPAKGSLAVRGSFLNLWPDAFPGEAISDIRNALFSDWIFDILRPDGSPLGTLVATGWAFGMRPAGFDSLFQGNLAITGGTGAFLGVRGQGGESAPPSGSLPFASVTEDPSQRRQLGGHARQFSFQLIPAPGNGAFKNE
jgi:hypothetical protein